MDALKQTLLSQRAPLTPGTQRAFGLAPRTPASARSEEDVLTPAARRQLDAHIRFVEELFRNNQAMIAEIRELRSAKEEELDEMVSSQLKRDASPLGAGGVENSEVMIQALEATIEELRGELVKQRATHEAEKISTQEENAALISAKEEEATALRVRLEELEASGGDTSELQGQLDSLAEEKLAIETRSREMETLYMNAIKDQSQQIHKLERANREYKGLLNLEAQLKRQGASMTSQIDALSPAPSSAGLDGRVDAHARGSVLGAAEHPQSTAEIKEGDGRDLLREGVFEEALQETQVRGAGASTEDLEAKATTVAGGASSSDVEGSSLESFIGRLNAMKEGTKVSDVDFGDSLESIQAALLANKDNITFKSNKTSILNLDPLKEAGLDASLTDGNMNKPVPRKAILTFATSTIENLALFLSCINEGNSIFLMNRG